MILRTAAPLALEGASMGETECGSSGFKVAPLYKNTVVFSSEADWPCERLRIGKTSGICIAAKTADALMLVGVQAIAAG